MSSVISQARFGLNEAANLAAMDPTLYGDLSTLPTNHYEIVLTLDSNGALAGAPGLSTGHYTLRLLVPTAASKIISNQRLRPATAINPTSSSAM